MNRRSQNLSLRDGHLAIQAIRAFSEGTLDSESSRAARTHLNVCKSCQRVLDELNTERAINETDHDHSSDTSVDAKTELPKVPGTVIDNQSASAKGSSQFPQSPPKKLLSVPDELLKLTDYKVIREIGRGAMGVLYLVEHRLTARQEVLKVIHPNLVDRDDVRDRFLREIQSAAKLNHPSVVQTLNAIEQGALLGLVMEYAPGETLAQMVNRAGPIDFDLALRFAIQATEGLVHASQKKMVHRDIKPSNLMITGSKENLSLKLLDFGLARSFAESELANDMTIEGRIIGTPHFMAPEQALNPSTADSRADIYSLGCSLYFALTGKRPFQGETAIAVLTAHQTQTPKPISAYRRNAPEAFVRVIEKMMAKQKGDRYRSSSELLVELQGMSSAQDSNSRKTLAPNNALQSNRPPRLLNANDANSNTTIFPLAKAPGRRKKQSSLLGSFLTFLLPPLFTLAVIYYAHAWKWGLQGLLSKQPQSSIVLRQLPPGAQVLIDGFPAQFQRQSADAAPMIPAAPGKYEITILFEGREAMKREIVVKPYERHNVNVEIILPQRKKDAPPENDTVAVIPSTQPIPESEASSVKPTQPADVSLPQIQPERVPERDMVFSPVPSPNLDALLEPAYTAMAALNFDASDRILSSLEGIQFTGESQNKLEAFQETHRLVSQYHKTLENALTQLSASETLTLRRLNPTAPKGRWSDDPIGFQFSDQTPFSVLSDDQVLVKAAIVDVSPKRLVLRVDGENRTFLPSELPLTIAAALFRLSPQEPWPRCELTLSAGCLMSSQATVEDRACALLKLQQAVPKGELSYDLTSIYDRFQNLKKDNTLKSKEEIQGREFKIKGRLIGHTAAIFKGYFLSDGRFVSCQQSAGRIAPRESKSSEHNLIVWEKNSLGGIELKRPIPGTVLDFKVSSNGKVLALLARNSQLKNHLEVWTESQKKSILADDIVTSGDISIFFSSLNSSILAVEESGKTMQWNLRTQQLIQKATRIDPMGSKVLLGTAVTGDLESILHSIDSNQTKLWQTSTGKTIASVELPKIGNRQPDILRRNNGVFYSMKLDAWVIAENDGSIHIFEKDMELKETFGEVLQSTLLLSEMSPNGQFLGFVDSSNRVMIYDLVTRSILAAWNLELNNTLTSISIDNAGTKVAIGDSLGNIQLFSQ